MKFFDSNLSGHQSQQPGRRRNRYHSLLAAGVIAAVWLSILGGFASPLAPTAFADTAAQSLPFAQNWTNTALIAADNDWSLVPGVIGYRGDDLTTAVGANPQTILADGAATPQNVIANQTNPNTLISGGIAEFQITDPVVALQGSGTADAPHLVLSLNTTNQNTVNVSYNLRDVDGSADNAVQPVALQYRVGNAGNYTNLPAGFVADATTGPNLATLVTPVSVTLPNECNNQALVQLRIMTANAAGNDEWVGVDDISVTGTSGTGATNPSATGAANPSTVEAGSQTLLTVAVTPGTNPTSTGIVVTGNLSQIGGAANQQFFDDGTNGDATAGDNTFSYLATVAAGTVAGAKSVAVSVVDAQSRTAATIIGLTVTNGGPVNPTATGRATPSQIRAGDAALLTVAVTPGSNPISSGIVVTADLSSVGGSAAQTFADNGANGDATANDNIFSFTLVPSRETAAGDRTFAATVRDAQNRTATANIALTILAATDPNEHLTLGNPTNAVADANQPNNYLLFKNQYSVSYNRDRGIPNWVSWHLDSTWRGAAARQDDFRPDQTLPQGFPRVTQTDYSGSGFDRGHHCPSADRTSTIADNSATFLMTNMMPQAPGNNQGPWERLEDFSRTLLPGNELYIVAGGVGVGGTGSNGGVTTTLANGKVTVPSYTWKVIVVLPIGESDVQRVDANTRTIAVIMPNRDNIRNDNWQKYIATVDQVERLTGYDFFSNVPTQIQDQIESRLDQANDQTAANTVAGGTYQNLDITAPNTNLTGNVLVTNTLTLGGSTLFGGASNYRVTLAPTATVNRISGFVNGQVEKQFDISNLNQAFEYPLGTTNGYSPVTTTLTALNQIGSSLTIQAVQGRHPSAPVPALALQRYWTLNETGDLAAQLQFRYLDADVPSGVADESNFRLKRFDGGLYRDVTAGIDPAGNTATTANSIAEFSDWTLLAVTGPTAAGVFVGGIAATVDGRALSKAQIVLTDAAGDQRTARTDRFGRYQFENVAAGKTYVISLKHKQYQAAPMIVSVAGETADANFVVLPKPKARFAAVER